MLDVVDLGLRLMRLFTLEELTIDAFGRSGRVISILYKLLTWTMDIMGRTYVAPTIGL